MLKIGLKFVIAVSLVIGLVGCGDYAKFNDMTTEQVFATQIACNEMGWLWTTTTWENDIVQVFCWEPEKEKTN